MTKPHKKSNKGGLIHQALNLGPHTCPWWFGYVIDNPIRRLIHNPKKVLGSFVSPGQTVVDIGCGFGYFSIALAKLVGPAGKVIALDIQPEMIQRAKRRAEKQNLANQIEFQVCEEDRLGVKGSADFVLAFWMVHEVADPEKFFTELKSVLKESGKILIAEPKGHVSARQFGKSLGIAEKMGFEVLDKLSVHFSRAVICTVK